MTEEPQEKSMRILVAMPNTGTVAAGTTASLVDMMQHFERSSAPFEKSARLILAQGSILPEIRHRLVAEAYEHEATHMLWVDSDMRFPEDSLNRLLNAGKHVVGVNYARKEPECRPTASALSGAPLESSPAGLVEVAHMGFGLMLVTMAAYDAITFPFFHFKPIPPKNVRFYGEDVTFGQKIRDAGVKMFCDTDLSERIEHIGAQSFQLKPAPQVAPQLKLVT
tara:strand:+ start:5687 stop:6355 length:669 start_codon:yes stop_codon:yes gene_type:complete